jgi:hypothetical protein
MAGALPVRGCCGALRWRTPVETNPIRVCELLVGLPDVNVLGVDDAAGGPIRVHVECRGPRPVCGECGSVEWVKDRPQVELVDLPAFGRPARLVWGRGPARSLESARRGWR